MMKGHISGIKGEDIDGDQYDMLNRSQNNLNRSRHHPSGRSQNTSQILETSYNEEYLGQVDQME